MIWPDVLYLNLIHIIANGSSLNFAAQIKIYIYIQYYRLEKILSICATGQLIVIYVLSDVLTMLVSRVCQRPSSPRSSFGWSMQHVTATSTSLPATGANYSTTTPRSTGNESAEATRLIIRGNSCLVYSLQVSLVRGLIMCLIFAFSFCGNRVIFSIDKLSVSFCLIGKKMKYCVRSTLKISE